MMDFLKGSSASPVRYRLLQSAKLVTEMKEAYDLAGKLAGLVKSKKGRGKERSRLHLKYLIGLS